MPPITTSEAADRTIDVIERDETVEGPHDQKPIKATQTFHVDSKILIAKSSYFRDMLLPGRWRESTQDVIRIEDSIVRMQIIFAVLRKLALTIDVNLDHVWSVIAGIEFYHLDLAPFKDWFNQWWEAGSRMQMHHATVLLYPTWRFDRAVDFAHLTKTIAYGDAGHSMERNPSEYLQYHLPYRIIRKYFFALRLAFSCQYPTEQMNASRGRLHTLLRRGLFGPSEELHRLTCKCRVSTAFGYEDALMKLELWPSKRLMEKGSVRDILNALLQFRYEAPSTACVLCHMNFMGKIRRVHDNVEKSFDGLCLDCMDRSKSKLRDHHEDYWHHDRMEERGYSRHCRFTHGQPTWYFSFLGRKEDRDRHTENREETRPEPAEANGW